MKAPCFRCPPVRAYWPCSKRAGNWRDLNPQMFWVILGGQQKSWWTAVSNLSMTLSTSADWRTHTWCIRAPRNSIIVDISSISENIIAVWNTVIVDHCSAPYLLTFKLYYPIINDPMPDLFRHKSLYQTFNSFRIWQVLFFSRLLIIIVVISFYIIFALCQQVIAVVCVENPAEADRMSLDLPIMKKMGDRVHIECKSIRPIGEWVEDLRKLAE